MYQHRVRNEDRNETPAVYDQWMDLSRLDNGFMDALNRPNVEKIVIEYDDGSAIEYRKKPLPDLADQRQEIENGLLQ